MAAPVSPTPIHWWQRRGPSFVVFVVVLVGIAVLTISAARHVAAVLPEVPKDRLGDDTWGAPMGMEQAGQFQLAHIPDCAAGAITRIVLWDADSHPYWEVSGPPTPMKSFVVGVAPTGFTVVTAYRQPPPGAVLRLVAFRRLGTPLGIRYRSTQLHLNRVVSGTPLSRFTPSGFQTAVVCGQESSVSDKSTTTTIP